ncbi:UNVERIFIED_CONTAM: hypothetical protein Slati_2903700 [Sesamum latifolium]|uniref:Uncharacterized protein n=1 Tax=Sesamum latifolium TaxID=2727402 RepID=A0AAW2VE83_9LAMI
MKHGSIHRRYACKSHSKDNHIQDLRECFDVIRRLRMKLNPSKCTFGVRGGKFLAYLISCRGMEANPEKIKAIQDMSPPDNKERSSEANRKNDGPKQIPISRSREGTAIFLNSEKEEKLHVFLSTLKEAVSAVLVRAVGREHQPVYYVSKSHQVTVLTNQPLKHILASANASGSMTKCGRIE